MDNKLISVIIPLFNNERFIREALDSVIAQDYHPLEIIVVDDGSTDNGADLVQSYGNCTCFKQENLGTAAAKNKGLALAKGEWIAFLDADDYWAPGFLTEFAGILAADPDIEILQGLTQEVQYNPATERVMPLGKPYFLSYCSSLYRKSVFDKVGVFDISLYSAEDLDWTIRAWENVIQLKRLVKTVLFYRQHDLNMTKNNERMLYFSDEKAVAQLKKLICKLQSR